MSYFSVLGSVSALATLSSLVRDSSERSAESKAKFSVMSNESAGRVLGVDVTPRNRRSTNGILQSGLSAQIISSWVGSSATAGLRLKNKPRPQATEAMKEMRSARIVVSLDFWISE